MKRALGPRADGLADRTLVPAFYFLMTRLMALVQTDSELSAILLRAFIPRPLELIAMGAPNALQGRSLSGNASALELLARGLVDILVADYHASSMLAAAFQIVAQGRGDLPAATRLISDTPARAVGRTDRGAIVAGRRADLLVVEQHGGLPIVAATLLRGTTTYAGGPFAAALAGTRREPSAAPAD